VEKIFKKGVPQNPVKNFQKKILKKTQKKKSALFFEKMGLIFKNSSVLSAVSFQKVPIPLRAHFCWSKDL
jgi:hypothetical protein